jgi:hypothetical protein
MRFNVELTVIVGFLLMRDRPDGGGDIVAGRRLAAAQSGIGRIGNSH